MSTGAAGPDGQAPPGRERHAMMDAYIMSLARFQLGCSARAGWLMTLEMYVRWCESGKQRWDRGDNLCSLGLVFQGQCYLFTAVYMLPYVKVADRRQSLVELDRLRAEFPSGSFEVPAGDWNARAGMDHIGDHVHRGQFSLSTSTTMGGRIHRAWLYGTDLCMVDSFRPCAKRAAWRRRNGNFYELDFFLASQCIRKQFQTVSSFSCGITDHWGKQSTNILEHSSIKPMTLRARLPDVLVRLPLLTTLLLAFWATNTCGLALGCSCLIIGAIHSTSWWSWPLLKDPFENSNIEFLDGSVQSPDKASGVRQGPQVLGRDVCAIWTLPHHEKAQDELSCSQVLCSEAMMHDTRKLRIGIADLIKTKGVQFVQTGDPAALLSGGFHCSGRPCRFQTRKQLCSPLKNVGTIFCDLGLLRAILGLCLACHGPMLAHQGAILGPSWAYVGPSWRHLGAMLDPPGPYIRPTLSHLGSVSAIPAPS